MKHIVKVIYYRRILVAVRIREYPVILISLPPSADRTYRMTGGFYIWCDLYSYEREITLNPEYWVCGGGRGWWLVVMVVVVDISRYFPIETDWCPSQHFHHQTSQHPPRHPASLPRIVGHRSLSLSLSILLWSGLTSNVFSGVKIWWSVLSLLCPALRTSQQSLVGGWGGSRQIFYHNYLLNQAVSPFTSHSLAVMEWWSTNWD